MPDENGTKATQDAQNAGESLFGDETPKPAAAVAEEEEAKNKTDQERQGSEVGEDGADGDESGPAENKGGGDGSGPPDNPNSQGEGGPADNAASEGESSLAEDLKVVVSIRGGSATIGVQRPSSDPHIESFDHPELPALAGEVSAVIERARVRWEEAPRHPAYARPTRSTSDRRRREQGSAQDSTADAEAARQQPRLF